MQASWKTKLEDLNQKKLQLLETLKKYPEETIMKKPSENQWSCLEICNHLMVIEQLSIGYIRSKIEHPEKTRTVSFKDKMKFFFMKIVLKLPFKLKAPKAVSTIPPPKKFSELVMIWDMTRTELEKVISRVPQGLEARSFFKHPFSGYMTIDQMLDFFIIHFQHHIPQVNKTLKIVNS